MKKMYEGNEGNNISSAGKKSKRTANSASSNNGNEPLVNLLPTEIMHGFFWYLKKPELDNAALVCKKWNAWVTDFKGDYKLKFEELIPTYKNDISIDKQNYKRALNQIDAKVRLLIATLCQPYEGLFIPDQIENGNESFFLHIYETIFPSVFDGSIKGEMIIKKLLERMPDALEKKDVAEKQSLRWWLIHSLENREMEEERENAVVYLLNTKKIHPLEFIGDDVFNNTLLAIAIEKQQARLVRTMLGLLPNEFYKDEKNRKRLTGLITIGWFQGDKDYRDLVLENIKIIHQRGGLDATLMIKNLCVNYRNCNESQLETKLEGTTMLEFLKQENILPNIQRNFEFNR